MSTFIKLRFTGVDLRHETVRASRQIRCVTDTRLAPHRHDDYGGSPAPKPPGVHEGVGGRNRGNARGLSKNCFFSALGFRDINLALTLSTGGYFRAVVEQAV